MYDVYVLFMQEQFLMKIMEVLNRINSLEK